MEHSSPTSSWLAGNCLTAITHADARELKPFMNLSPFDVPPAQAALSFSEGATVVPSPDYTAGLSLGAIELLLLTN